MQEESVCVCLAWGCWGINVGCLIQLPLLMCLLGLVRQLSNLDDHPARVMTVVSSEHIAARIQRASFIWDYSADSCCVVYVSVRPSRHRHTHFSVNYLL